jgi:uncharacterized membrane protein
MLMKILPPLEDDDTMISALSYPFWYIASWMVFLSKKKEEPFIKFHTLQSLFFGMVMFLVNLVLTLIVYGIFRCVPSAAGIINQPEHEVVWKGYMWKGVFFPVIFAIYLFLLFIGMIIVLYCAYKTYRGVYFKIPYIGQYIENRYFSYLKEADEDAPEPPAAPVPRAGLPQAGRRPPL